MVQKNLIIVDDFYNNPVDTRKFILTQDFSVVGNYPGYRTKSYANDDVKAVFEKYIGKKINYWPGEYNGSFQYTTKDMKSWIHRDVTSWAGILYLTPDAPPSSGTAFFKHRETGVEFKDQYDNLSDEDKNIVDGDGRDLDKWDIIDNVGNKFNRLILFRGTRNHMSMDYFGDDKYNGRLFQLWFFNVDESSSLYSTPKPTPVLPKPTINKHIPICIKEGIKNICVLFFTTSRYEYLIPTLESFHRNVDFGNNNVYKILIDDYPLRRDEDILNGIKDDYNISKLIMNDENMGYSLTWKKAWENVPSNIDYIWHQEDDFTFNYIVKVDELISLLENKETQLFQVHLKRNIVFENNDFIRDVENNKVGNEIKVNNKELIVSKRYFNPNPGLYPYWVTREDFDQNPQESPIINYLAKTYPNGYSAMLGSRLSPNIVNHIGEYTQGKKVLPGEPGWDWLKKYDPDKKYYSSKYLTLYE